MKHAYLGPADTSDDAWDVLNTSGVPFRDYRKNVKGLLSEIVDRLVAGQVIGWFSGPMEFGPRALGSRSILADPRRPDMQDRVNALIKQRESFRPFAPAVLESFAHEHFALDHPSPFMLETCDVISPIPLPAITHVDGSARVQTVTRDTHPRFAALLEHFHRRTGCPILLNTSFNLRGEPMVCSIMDAISTFGRSEMNALVVEDLLIDRRDIPSSWRRFSRTARPSAQDHVVYTMF